MIACLEYSDEWEIHRFIGVPVGWWATLLFAIHSPTGAGFGTGGKARCSFDQVKTEAILRPLEVRRALLGIYTVKVTAGLRTYHRHVTVTFTFLCVPPVRLLRRL